jgi:hypothetical protein
METRAWKAILAMAMAMAAVGAAQNQTTFQVRLSPVARDTSMLATATGYGSATAVLAGTKLTVTGEFHDMRSVATVAHIHSGAATGVRGPAVFELTVEKAESGKLSGSFTLTAEQIESLHKGRFYIQIQSEKAPEGAVWGWLLPQGGS